MGRTSDFDARLADLAAVQHGAIARDQLLDIGSEKQIRHRCKQGILERTLRDVYRLRGAAPTWRQSLISACFASGKSSVASFRAATALWFLPCGEEIIEITSPRDRRVRIDGLIPHESFHLTQRDVTYVDNIPVTRPARTIVDLSLLVTTGELRRADFEFAIHEAIRRSLVDLRQLWLTWERLGGAIRPGGVLMRGVLERFQPPARTTDTTPETRLLLLFRDAGLPEPVPQHRVWISPTRWYDLDFAWPERKGFAEFNSRKWHGWWDKYVKDTDRVLDLQARGWHGVAITDEELAVGAPKAINALRTILGRRRVA
jgi:hypothetical protein